MLQAKEELAKDIMALQQSFNHMQHQIQDDNLSLWRGVSTSPDDDVLLAIGDNRKDSQLSLELNNIEYVSGTQQLAKLAAEKQQLMQDLEETESILRIRAAGSEELEEMHEMLLKKMSSCSSTVDDTERVAFEGEIEGLESKITLSAQAQSAVQCQIDNQRSKIQQNEQCYRDIQGKQAKIEPKCNGNFTARAQALLQMAKASDEAVPAPHIALKAKAMDRNADGVIDRAEWVQAVKATSLKSASSPCQEATLQAKVSSRTRAGYHLVRGGGRACDKESEQSRLKGATEVCESVLEELQAWQTQLVQKLQAMGKQEDIDPEEEATMQDELECLTQKVETKLVEKSRLEKELRAALMAAK